MPLQMELDLFDIAQPGVAPMTVQYSNPVRNVGPGQAPDFVSARNVGPEMFPQGKTFAARVANKIHGALLSVSWRRHCPLRAAKPPAFQLLVGRFFCEPDLAQPPSGICKPSTSDKP